MAEYSGLAYESEGALVVDIAEPEDAHKLPPVLLRKADGAVLYSTTDLATIAQRVRNFAPDAMLYVVDNRQSTHFVQVFRGARKLGIVAPEVLLEHIGFGTMNGTDGRPFKTRAGGTMKLKDLIGMVTDRALERLREAEIGSQYSEEEQREIARKVGISMLKFADFSNARQKDYVFDLDRFSSFEGRTGPYLLYTTVRANSILRKAGEAGFSAGALLAASSEAERALLLHLTRFGEALERAWEKRAPSELCEYAYGLAVAFSAFYRDHHILTEENCQVRASYLRLARIFRDTMGKALELLGIEVPERM
jgi:arginyl-tRNA synthetase